MIYQPLVSIIMPVYNAGQYFKPCVESILNQTLKDIELILVLDKPTDGTDRLAYEYAKLDNRIIILQNEENLHIGLSRNQGLAIAKGKYIAFSDHDDLRELTMYQTLYKIAEKNDLDILLSLSCIFATIAPVGFAFLISSTLVKFSIVLPPAIPVATIVTEIVPSVLSS